MKITNSYFLTLLPMHSSISKYNVNVNIYECKIKKFRSNSATSSISIYRLKYDSSSKIQKTSSECIPFFF